MSTVSSTSSLGSQTPSVVAPIDSSFQRIGKIHNFLGEGLTQDAVNEIKLLSKEAIELIQNEIKSSLSNTPPFNFPIAELSQEIQYSAENIKDKALLKSLSKVYRLWVGMNWYQAYKLSWDEVSHLSQDDKKVTKKIDEINESRDKKLDAIRDLVLQTSDTLLNQLAGEKGKQPSKARLNYTYTQKALTPSKKNTTTSSSSETPAQEKTKASSPINPEAPAQAETPEQERTRTSSPIKDFIADFPKWSSQLEKEGHSLEFVKIHYLSWSSTSLTQLKDFLLIEKATLPAEYIGKKYFHYTAYLVGALVKLIRNPQVEKELKDHAFSRLVELASLREENSFAKRLSEPKEGSSSAIKDCFLETRLLAKKYLHALAQEENEEYKPYREASGQALQAFRADHLEQGAFIENRLKQLKSLKVDLATKGRTLNEEKKAANRGEATNFDEQISQVKESFSRCVAEEKALKTPEAAAVILQEAEDEQKAFEEWEG